VPGRNCQFLLSAWQYAVVNGIGVVVFGGTNRIFEGVESFPDQREDNLQLFAQALNACFGLGGDDRIRLLMPCADLDKHQVASRIPAHLRPLTVSCNREGSVACGFCDSCLQAKRAYDMADGRGDV